MAITEVETPIQVERKLVNTTQAYAEKHWFQTPQLKNTPRRDLTLSIPHPVFVVTLPEANVNSLLTLAHLTSWRYLIFREIKQSP